MDAESSRAESSSSGPSSHEREPHSSASPDQAVKKCPHCGTEMPASASYCPACGWSMTPIPAAERLVAAAAYLTFVAGAIILFLPEFRKNRFVRFHAWQSTLLWGVFAVLTVTSLFLSNIAAALAFLMFGILASLAMLFLWIVLTVKAWQGERFELPLFGTLAERMP